MFFTGSPLVRVQSLRPCRVFITYLSYGHSTFLYLYSVFGVCGIGDRDAFSRMFFDRFCFIRRVDRTDKAVVDFDALRAILTGSFSPSDFNAVDQFVNDCRGESPHFHKAPHRSNKPFLAAPAFIQFNLALLGLFYPFNRSAASLLSDV